MSRTILGPSGVLRPTLPSALLEAVALLDLDGGSLWLATELVALQPGLEAEDRDLLHRIVLAILAAERRGSTRLLLVPEGPEPAAVESETDREGARGILAALGLVEVRHAALLALLEDPDRCGALVGAPGGDPRPLLRVGESLCLRRTHQAEAGLAARLSRRLLPVEEGGSSSLLAESSTAPTRTALATLAALDEAGARRAVEQAEAEEASRPGGAPALTDEQREACVAALLRPLSVITGGPGTGKTTIVATLLRALAAYNSELLGAVALTAPTGKAADRLTAVAAPGGPDADRLTAVAAPGGPDADRPHTLTSSSNGSTTAGGRDAKGGPAAGGKADTGGPAASVGPATTLHRLLGYRPRSDRFLHHEHNPLEAAFVICDEASMIDLTLMDRLLRALLPGARLLLLGDADQLPPVGAGAVLRDLCEAPAAATAVSRLTHSHRQSANDPGGASILTAAAGLNVSAPDSDGAIELSSRGSTAELRWEGAEHLPAKSERERRVFLEAWEQRHLVLPPELRARLDRPVVVGSEGEVSDEDGKLSALLAHHERARILCLTRIPAGGTGTLAVNAHFARRLASRMDQAPSPLAPGTPVMVTRNDYTHGLFNGDTGLIVRARLESGALAPMALFSRSGHLRVTSPGSLADRLEPAFAITVHKSQGSEYEAVAILLPAVEVKLLSREILYTAFTRARHSVVLVGDDEQLRRAAAMKRSRETGLAALLAGP